MKKNKNRGQWQTTHKEPSPSQIVKNAILAEQGQQMVKLLTKKLKIANEKIQELEAKLEVLTNQTQTL